VSYTSRIEGTLALHPFPDDDAIPALRAALAALGGPGGGRLVLTPLGRGLGFEDTVDWTAALESIERAILTVLSPRNLAFMGVLRAIGEDEALLATITVNGGAVNVEHHEATEIEASEEKEVEWAAFLEYADELDLSHHADGLLGLCVASLRLEPRKKSTLKSRIGGLPDAPAGFPWPTSDGGEPLSFVAQLDLAEVRASGLPSATLLPERGLLSFFHGYAPGARDEDERPVHRLLGYADPLQSDVYLCTEANATGLPLASWGSLEHHRAAARWQLLLQIDSDPAREMLFGDNGVLAFMIREDDLAARRFDRVWVDWQSH
jgi:uncharacterized protein YwqG